MSGGAGFLPTTNVNAKNMCETLIPVLGFFKARPLGQGLGAHARAPS